MKPALSLTTDPIPKLIWQIALPMSIGMFFNTMFNVVDTFCAGWLGTEALAALSLSFPVFFFVYAFGSGISQGTTALLSNSLGGGNAADARRVFAQALLFVTIAGIALSIIGWLTAPWLFEQLGAEGKYLGTTLAYMNVILAGGVFVLLPMVINSALSAEGNTLPYRNFLIAGFFANLLLNPLFILGWMGLPRMGVGGIALATVIVQIGGGIYLWSHAMKSEIHRGLKFRDLKPEFTILRQIAGQAIPASLNMLTIAIGVIVITWFVKHFGQEAVAAIGIATRIEQIVLMPSIGLNFAVLSIVGQNYGAGHHHRVRDAWITNVKYGALMMVAGGLIIMLTREFAMRVFTDDPIVIAHGRDYLLSASITLAAYPILFITVFALQGLKRPIYGLWIGLYRQLIAPIIVFHTLTFTLAWGLWGIWWGVCLVTWSAAIFSFIWGWRKIGTKPLQK
ncbi:MATE family efflux transporter [Haloferula chungangensis]|uniref:MATE family efflux transporter n=1 Tax=Haloferula chungangensis TaxID=1048331 RepID=A0ABW2LBG9_9BACT